MRLVNYKYGYLFDCSIHGKIVMTKGEWEKVKTYLMRATKDIFWKGVLLQDFTRSKDYKNGKIYNVRVTATEKLVKKFGLKRYKRGNYMIEVV